MSWSTFGRIISHLKGEIILLLIMSCYGGQHTLVSAKTVDSIEGTLCFLTQTLSVL